MFPQATKECFSCSKSWPEFVFSGRWLWECAHLVLTPVLDHALGSGTPEFLLKSLSWLLGWQCVLRGVDCEALGGCICKSKGWMVGGCLWRETAHGGWMEFRHEDATRSTEDSGKIEAGHTLRESLCAVYPRPLRPCQAAAANHGPNHKRSWVVYALGN